jgi:hypothetical protein
MEMAFSDLEDRRALQVVLHNTAVEQLGIDAVATGYER